MKSGGLASKTRLALAFFVVALLLTIGLLLTFYSEARRELENRQQYQVRVEAALLAAQVAAEREPPSQDALRALLTRHGLTAALALYTAEGRLISGASAIDLPPDAPLLRPRTNLLAGGGPPAVNGVLHRGGEGYDVAEVFATDATILVLAKPAGRAASQFLFYVFSYQVIALLGGLVFIFFLARRMLRPYRRLVEVAQGSPVRAAATSGESDFVLETFQAVIDKLQAKEKELAQMHERERRRAERSERFSERVIASIPSGLVAINSQGVVTSANPHALALFSPAEANTSPAGSDQAAASVATASDYHYEDFFRAAPRLAEMVTDCLGNGTFYRREEVDVSHADGRVRHLGLSISPIADGSQTVEGALCLVTDLTEVIELRERMKLQENLANLGEMAAGLAHEFKNSLATIHGYVQLLEAQGEADGSPIRRRTLDATLNEVRLLARLVTDFLNFARPEHYNLTDVDLRTLLEGCLEEARPQLDGAGIEARLEGEFPTLMGDETLLRRVFLNLVRNAAEAIDPQSPHKQIIISGAADAGRPPRYAHVRVRDTGGGISPRDLQRIFIPFFTTKSRGYGIGLALVQKILVGHGGGVSVEKSDVTGTVFHCRLPLVSPPRPGETR